MGNQQTTFAKRQREADLKDKARAKEARRAMKKERDEVRGTKGPEIAWNEAVHAVYSAPPPPAAEVPPDLASVTTSSTSSSSSRSNDK